MSPPLVAPMIVCLGPTTDLVSVLMMGRYQGLSENIFDISASVNYPISRLASHKREGVSKHYV